MLYQDHESVIRAIYTGSQFLESVGSGSEVGIVLESTSFYAEQGGQVLYTLGFFLYLVLSRYQVQEIRF